MARTPQVHNSTNSQTSSSMSGEGSHEVGSSHPPPDSNMANVTVTSTVSNPNVTVPNPTMPITTMAFHTISPGHRSIRPPPFTTNPLYGPIPTPTTSFQAIPVSEPNRYAPPRVTPMPLTTASVLSLRQQMDESNHDMVNLLTQQIGTVFNPLIQNTNDSYQMLAYQMGRIADFFGTPPQTQPRINQVAPQMILPADYGLASVPVCRRVIIHSTE
ncbi:hypothetical protein QL285_076464 [Trifolium repens]|nr:hypothetical protein QL285_076464 [Trifolium repens]